MFPLSQPRVPAELFNVFTVEWLLMSLTHTPAPTCPAPGWAGKHYRTLEGFPKLPADLELAQKTEK
jgi:hypothetical protein